MLTYKFEIGNSKTAKTNPDQVLRFYEDLTPLLRYRVEVILLLGVYLVPLFALLDYFLYPAQWRTFLAYRMIASGGCLILWAVNRSRESGNQSFYLGLTAFYLVGGIIIKMILEQDSLSTPYYAWLNLVFIGFCILLPGRTRRTFLHTLVLYAIYLILTLTMNWPRYDFVFLANNLFVVATLVIAFVGAHTNMRLRWKVYLLRMHLERMQEMLRMYSSSLEVLVDKKQQALVREVRQLEEQQEVQLKTQQATNFGLAKPADSKDKYAGEHLERPALSGWAGKSLRSAMNAATEVATRTG